MKLVFLFLLLVMFDVSHASSQVRGEPTYAVWDLDKEVLLFDNNSETVRPMASITKLMSALVILSSNLNMDELLTVTGVEGSNRIRPGMKITRQDLLNLSLISSDNLAARTLAETYPGGYIEFIHRMNSMALDLGMRDTVYADATGLLAGNVTTASDLYKLVLAASGFSFVFKAANTITHEFAALTQVKQKARSVKLVGRTTNLWVGKLNLFAAKTGFTSSAGRCIAMLFTKNNKNYLLVVLGAKNLTERDKLIKTMIAKIK